MLGGSCSPCCGKWYCYDYQYCACYADAPVSLKPTTRYFFMMPRFTINTISYGRYTQLGVTYISKYDQSSFDNSLKGTATETGGGFFSYGGDAEFPAPQQIMYMEYRSGGSSLCPVAEFCQYQWKGRDIGGTSFARFAFFDYQQNFNSFYQELYLNIACTMSGFVPSFSGGYVVGAASSTDANPLTATWGSPGFGTNTQAKFIDFTFDPAIGVVPPDSLLAQWPPQPDIRHAKITRSSFDESRCFAYEFVVEYPLKKYSLVPSNPSKLELLTVGNLKIRVGDVSAIGNL
ncbi:MAG: hypothetical protein EBR82_64460 [Caulobacteraceae bacterium]|nr:hypothetical protein [Caulobacteraceae bacterium]